MAIELKLPDLGEGIEDVTISRWRVSEGDEVKPGEIVLEVATDKVDTEVPAPAGGRLLKILFSAGEIAPVSATLALIGAAGEEVPTSAAPSAPVLAEPEPPTPADSGRVSPVARRVAAEMGVALSGVGGSGPGGQITKDDVLAHAAGRTQPAAETASGLPGELAGVAALAVRRAAADHNVDLTELAAGRPLSTLTRYDVLSAVASVEPRFLPPPGWEAAPSVSAPTSALPPPAGAVAPLPAAVSPAAVGAREELVKHSRMRQAVARNTAQSAFTAPHVTTMWDVEMTRVLAHRRTHKKEFEAAGVNLTVTAYLIAAILDGLRAVPAANASWSEEGVLIKRTYNIGMAVALPADRYGMGGLIVPVIKNAGDLNLLGLARAVNELAEKARTNALRPEDLADGTFTLSNYGVSGSRFQTPVIVQPQVGILGVGAIEKRPVVVSAGHPLDPNPGDALAFLPMTTLGFSYDHRVLDGATADAFCAAVKRSLEGWA